MREQGAELDVLTLERARAGDHAAFRELVLQHDAGLRALAFRLLGDRGRMDDVLQEAYVKAFRGLAKFRGDANVRTWIYRITYNACMDELRRRPRRDDLPLDEDTVGAPTAPDPGEAVVARSSLAAALALLPPDQRAAVMLVDAEGFDYGAAARILGVAEGTVASRVSRARATLRRTLGADGREAR